MRVGTLIVVAGVLAHAAPARAEVPRAIIRYPTAPLTRELKNDKSAEERAAAYRSGNRKRRAGIVLCSIGGGMVVPGLGWTLAGRTDGHADSGMGMLNFVGGVFLTAASIQLLVGIPLLADGIVESRENRPPPPFSLVVHPGGAGFRYVF